MAVWWSRVVSSGLAGNFCDVCAVVVNAAISRADFVAQYGQGGNFAFPQTVTAKASSLRIIAID
jgi:hypothetical protein